MTGTDLGRSAATSSAERPLLLNIFPSVDTPVCANSVRKFNEQAAASGLSVLCVSKDLPFTLSRFCGAEGIENVTSASASGQLRRDYGVTMADGAMAGLLARSVVVVAADGTVAYTQLVPGIAEEPDYDAALAAAAAAAG